MKKDVQREKLIAKAGPFFRLWSDIENKRPVFLKNKELGEYAFITLAVGEEYCNLFEYLQEGNSNFIFIDGIGEENARARGLLCIDENWQMASSDDCFFVGVIIDEDADIEKEVLLTARQLFEFVGENAKYLVCNIAILSKNVALEKSIGTFLEKIEMNE